MSIARHTGFQAEWAQRANSRRRLAGIALVLLSVFVLAPGLNTARQSSAAAQTNSRRILLPDPFGPDRNDPMNSPAPAMQARGYKTLNARRQQSMVEDSNKLLNLTAQLSAEVTATHPRGLTADQLSRLAEIEKLARSIRDKMSIAVGPNPQGLQPPNVFTNGLPYIR